MTAGSLLLVLVGVAALCGPLEAQDKPVVAMIGTGNFAAVVGPAIGRAGYPVVYGSRDPARDSVRMLVQRTGPTAAATTVPQAVARAQIVILAVPSDVVVDVSSALALAGKVVVDVGVGR